MGFRRLAIAAIATAVTVTAIPATAQTAADDARFRAAQARFDREYQIYRQEVDRYQAERGRGYSDRGPDYEAATVSHPQCRRTAMALTTSLIMIRSAITATARNIASGCFSRRTASMPGRMAAIIAGGRTARPV